MKSSEIDLKRNRHIKDATLNSLGLTKSIIEEPMGFTASPDLIIDLINLIALPISKDVSKFGKIVLNFNAKRREIWWTNETIGGLFFVNFGYATYDYFNKCWGDGQIGINADKLSENLKMFEREKVVTFCAYPISKIYSIQKEKIKLITGYLETITEIPTAKSENRIKLDHNYIPILKEEDRMLKYGAELNASELKLNYPLEITVNQKGLLWGKGGIKLGIKNGSFLPPKEEIHLLIDNRMEALAKNLKGIVTLRVSKGEKTPLNPKTSLYLLKKDQSKENPNGVMKSGILLCVDKKKTESEEMMDMF